MARYRLTASSAARSQRAALIDAVEVGSIDLGELRDAPEVGVLLHVFVYHVALVDQQETQAQRLHFPRRGAAYARRKLGFDDFRGVREVDPTSTIQKDFHLHACGPRGVALK